MVTVRPEVLRPSLAAIFTASGATEADAETVAASLVEAELAGHPSHGVIRVAEYVRQIRDGKLKPAAQPEVLREGPTTLVVDGCRGFGQVVARWATERLIEKALEYDVAAVTIRRSGHIGRVGPYAAMVAEQGLLGLAFVNGGGTTPRMAPYGGGRPVFGTNPLAAAIPMSGLPPILIDFSTAVVASGKIRVFRDRGEPLPEGWILDKQGRPSRDPSDYYDGGMLLPAAGHKGYGLAVLVEVMGGLLTAAGSTVLSDDPAEIGNGTCLIAVNPAAFGAVGELEDRARAMGDVVKSTPPAAGFAEVLLPGEPEQRSALQKTQGGVDIAEATWNSVLAAAEEVGVSSLFEPTH